YRPTGIKTQHPPDRRSSGMNSGNREILRLRCMQDRSRRFTVNVEEMRVEGDKFENIGANAVTINRSLLINALNHVILDQKDEVATGIREVADNIDSSGNTEASAAFNEFLEELAQPQPRPSRLKLFWDGVLNALPSTATLDDAAAKIADLF
ncbi:MAG: hypothetical protein ACLP9Y_09485, partial [Mycobacterium sp.]